MHLKIRIIMRNTCTQAEITVQMESRRDTTAIEKNDKYQLLCRWVEGWRGGPRGHRWEVVWGESGGPPLHTRGGPWTGWSRLNHALEMRR